MATKKPVPEELKCPHCVRERTLVRLKPDSEAHPDKVLYQRAPWCKVHLRQKQKAAAVLGWDPDFWMRRQVPRTKITINQGPEEKVWHKRHQHPEVDSGSIGGGQSTTYVHTSIGDLKYLFCGICGEEAYAHDENW